MRKKVDRPMPSVQNVVAQICITGRRETKLIATRKAIMAALVNLGYGPAEANAGIRDALRSGLVKGQNRTLTLISRD